MKAKNIRDFKNKNSYSYNFRQKRMRIFFDQIQKKFENKAVSILDVGGTVVFWETFLPDELSSYQITVLNLTIQNEGSGRIPNIQSICGDATRMPEFDNNHFDVVFSNSVIEHVGTLMQQKKMADEVKRVGKFIFLQTPNRYFPIEPHFHSNIPYLNFFPDYLKVFIIQKCNNLSRERAMFYCDSIRLLNRRELEILFPNDFVIEKEKYFGFTKSFMVYSKI